MLIAKYNERAEYGKAQVLIDRLPGQMADKNQMQANLYLKQGNDAKAAELLETKLLRAANDAQSTLLALMQIALHEKDTAAAEHFAAVSEKTAELYDLWDYNRYVAHLLLAVAQKDTAQSLLRLQQMCAAMQKSWTLDTSLLYRHTKQKKSEDSFATDMMTHLLQSVKTDPEMAFLRENPEYVALLQQYGVA